MKDFEDCEYSQNLFGNDPQQAQSEQNNDGDQASRLKQGRSLSPNNQIKKKKKNIPNSNLLASLTDTKYLAVKSVLKKQLGLRITRDPTVSDWDLYWTDNVVVPQQLARMKPHQKINHFPGMFTLSRKNYLARNLGKMAKMFPSEYEFYPKTWILPSQLNELRNYMESQSNPVVIAKPEASCQGKGIFLTKNVDDFQFGEHYVVQKYLKKPLIVEGLKFDLRIYVLVAGCDPLRVYIYKQGLARFATQTYAAPKKDNLANLFMHLTNYSINKNSQKFEFNQSHSDMERGHKRSLTSIAKHLGSDWEKVWTGSKDIIVKTLISTEPILKHHYRSCQPENYANNMCFEILGFDIIIDSNLNPMLLQVNYTPSFSIDTPLDKMIKENLIRDSLVLMNLSGKAKSDVLTTKKRQMLERTLTGKKVWYSRQQRQKIVIKAQKKRDQWENTHLGNFQKIFPVNIQTNQRLHQQYHQFLTHSRECYESITGANIRRNQKVQKSSTTKEIPSNSQLLPDKGDYAASETINEILPLRQGLKLTNTKHLQRIYKAPIKQMLPRRKREKIVTGSKTESGSIFNAKTIAKRTPTIQDNQLQVNSKIMLAKNRPSSAVKRAGVSNVYNITFKGKE